MRRFLFILASLLVWRIRIINLGASAYPTCASRFLCRGFFELNGFGQQQEVAVIVLGDRAADGPLCAGLGLADNAGDALQRKVLENSDGISGISGRKADAIADHL